MGGVDNASREYGSGAVPFATGYYLFHLRMQVGWGPGANGANNLNGFFTFYDGPTALQGISWGRLKTGSTGHGYGTVTEYGYEERWCYHSQHLAQDAFEEWAENPEQKEPTGWHRHPSTGRRMREDGTMYVHF